MYISCRSESLNRFPLLQLDDCGVKYYGLKNVPPCFQLSSNAKLPGQMSRFQTLLSFVLLPVTLNPHSKFFLGYETFRKLLISLTVFIVPFQVRY